MNCKTLKVEKEKQKKKKREINYSLFTSLSPFLLYYENKLSRFD